MAEQEVDVDKELSSQVLRSLESSKALEVVLDQFEDFLVVLKNELVIG